jgi:pimeloyl-ACP methyl ester carboxylesterase
VFRYPNDQPVADSAKLLAGELKEFAEDHPGRGVSLVTSSMGGLVARAVIEDPDLDPGNVRQLIMIAPPNHGSALARFGFGLDLWEHVSGRLRKEETRLFYSLVEDGLSEAAADLRPDSPFLRQLNARERNPRVRYTILLGTGGPLRPMELAALRKSVAAAGQRTRWVRFFGARTEQWLEDLDEVVEGKGDGAVSIERGRLEGVKDTVLLKFRHAPELPARVSNDMDKLHQEIVKRIVDSGQWIVDKEH